MLTRGVAHVICIAEHVPPRPLNADHVAPRPLSTLNKQVCICGCQAEFPKTANIFEQKTQKMLIICQIDWREVGVAFELQCLRNCTLSSLFLYC